MGRDYDGTPSGTSREGLRRVPRRRVRVGIFTATASRAASRGVMCAVLPIRHVLAAILATIPFLAAHAAWRELHDHLMALPNLERAHPFLNEPPAACRRALGLAETAAVMAPSAPKAP